MTPLFAEKQLRVFAVDEDGHLCAGRISFEVSLPLAAVAPILDERMMSSAHFVADIAPAAVQFQGKSTTHLIHSC